MQLHADMFLPNIYHKNHKIPRIVPSSTIVHLKNNSKYCPQTLKFEQTDAEFLLSACLVLAAAILWDWYDTH